MNSSKPTEIGLVNRGMAYVDKAIDAYVIANIDTIADAERRDDTSHWSGLVSRILKELETTYPPGVAKEVGAYAIDRVTARRSESPLFTDELSRRFIKQYKIMPEGPAWAAYAKSHYSSRPSQELL